MIILYTENNKLALDYAELYSTNNVLINWYKDIEAVKQYRMAHNPEPSAFPSVTDGKKIWRVADISQSPDWIRDEWAGKHLTDQQKLDAFIYIPKLDIRRALREMGKEGQLKAILEVSEEFQSDWNDSNEINTADPMLLQALSQTAIVMDDVKKKILGI